MILFLIALLAGVLTVLAPCTISLLPIIVGGTLGGGTSYRRALVVVASLGVSIILFTLLLKVSSLFLNIPQDVWQYISGTIIVFLGFAMLAPTLWDKIPFLGALNRSSNKLIGTGYQKQNMLGDVLIGAALGPVFSSCSPTYFLILAEVLPKNFTEGLVYLLAYAFGLCASLLVIAVAGQKLLSKVGVASDPRGLFKRGIGLLFLILGIAIFFGYDKQLELAAANHIFDVTKLEQSLLEAQQHGGQLLGASQGTPAPEITDPSGFINTGGLPITIGQFKGKKVVLIDFWTYSCINCQRTLPYVKAWYDKYESQGLEIISIHTPEFAFEKVQANVQSAVEAEGIKYPVVLDNDYGTWNAFGNQFWPHKYLIDINGSVVYDHAGEGDYDVTEAAIQKALAQRAHVLGIATSSLSLSGVTQPVGVVSVDSEKVASPETYFGSNRNEFLGNGRAGVAGVQTLMLPAPAQTAGNTLYLGGSWNFSGEYAENTSPGAKIVYQYSAKNVYFVASAANPTTITILLDGKVVGQKVIQANTLYPLIEGSDYGQHTLEIDIPAAGLDAYTFTFG